MTDAMPSREQWIAGGSRRALPAIGHTVFVRQDGPPEGAPVTLLHGFPSSSHDWAAVVPALVHAGHRVTAVDFLGLGESDKPHPYAYSLLEQADVVEAVWSSVGQRSTALVAHDYGVSVAQELLARDPHRVTSMTWLNGGVFPDLHHPIPEQKLLHGPAGPEAARQLTEDKFAASLARLTGRPFSGGVAHDMWLGAVSRDGLEVLPELLRYLDEREEFTVRWVDAIRTYAGPQQFIWGPADPISGAHVLPRIREVVPQAKLTVLDEVPAVGHFPQVEAPELVGPLLVRRLAGNQ
ncbi:alpha/beta fold hydrolase [Actinacidiphila glaucinigra]|uniref:alpha/beta fold hydrolase n=1 Tax=Actinacidiphila glaucinigra TaxID=235986 RepID=UPI0035DBFE57